MIWVLGWPLSFEFAQQYTRDEHLLPEMKHPCHFAIMYGAATDLLERAALPCSALKCCWVREQAQSVLALSVAADADSAETAAAGLSRARLPPLRCMKALAGLLDVTDVPQWYRYCDGTWDPLHGDYEEEDEEYDTDSDEVAGVDDREWWKAESRWDEPRPKTKFDSGAPD